MTDNPNRIRSTVTYGENTVTFHFGTGTGDEWKEQAREEFNLSELGEEIKHQIALYGLNKALSDRTSDVSKQVQTEGPEVRLQAMREVWEQFANGTWKRQAASGGSKGGISLIVQAVARVKDASPASVQKSWQALSNEQKEKIKERKDVKAALEEIKAEQSQEEADLSDLM